MELNKIYFESLGDPKLKQVMHCHPKVQNRGKDMHFGDRSTFHKVARIIYKVNRSLYVSIVFYFVPFFVLFLNLYLAKYEDHAEH